MPDISDKEIISYKIITTEIKPYTYLTPLVAVDDHGELVVEYSKSDPKHLKKVILLNLEGRDEKGSIVSYEPLEVVNRFILSLNLENEDGEYDQYSKALTHFFSYLIKLQEAWDANYDEDLHDELVDLPRPTWNNFPRRPSDRITYKYRKDLKHKVLHEPDKASTPAKTTASAYMRAVVAFYKYYLRQGYEFPNPPFKHEVITVNYAASGTNMNAYSTKEVHTTDLRLNFTTSKKNQGGSLPSPNRDLMPLTNSEWKEVANIVLNTRRVVKNVEGKLTSASLAIEYCLLFLICRFTGMRKEEAASLHTGQIVKPNLNKHTMRIGIGGQYGSLTKTKDGGNKSRRTIIPTKTMQMLYEYTRSDRYSKRLAKFKALCKLKRKEGDDAFFDVEDGIDENKEYLFISQSGKPLFTKLNDINTRWNEVRATVEKKTGKKMLGVVHNLRPTFGVSLFRALLKVKDADEALALVSKCFGHEDVDTTLKYLTIAQDDPTGDEIFEDVLEFSGVFDILDELDMPITHEGATID